MPLNPALNPWLKIEASQFKVMNPGGDKSRKKDSNSTEELPKVMHFSLVQNVP